MARGWAGSVLVGALILAGPGPADASVQGRALLQPRPADAAPPAAFPLLGQETEALPPGSPAPESPGPASLAPAAPAPASTLALARTALLAALAVAATAFIVRKGLYDPAPASRPPDAPFPATPDWPAMLLAGLTLWMAQMVGSLSAVRLLNVAPGRTLDLRDASLLSMGGYLGFLVGAAFVFGVLPGMTRLVRLAGTHVRPLRDLRLGAAALALTLPIVLTIAWLASLLASFIKGQPPPAIAHETLEMLAAPGAATEPASAPWWWLTVACVVIGAPVAEECVYRGCIQGAIRRARAADPPRRAAWTAVLGTSLLFAAMHAHIAEPHALVPLLVLSVILGVVHERTGSLWVPIAMHALFNLANITLALWTVA
ncbi:MAG: CPBP family intramembrane glutamic endopeptidase [Planctomycetota bacterium]|nr:CPBP family intramembrane glutamic endopeptidase [Planctomycetota bacterium]